MSKLNKREERIVEEFWSLPDEALEEGLDKATDKLAAGYEKPKNEIVHVVDLEETLKKVRAERDLPFKGHSTGYKSLDTKMGGLEPGSVVLIAGETSHGKSALATNIAARVSPKVPLLYVSLEMTIEQMMDRFDRVAGEDLTKLDVSFQKSFAINYKDLEPLIQQAKKINNIGIVVLDYLQYLGRGMTLDEVARMSKEVKSLALRYEVCMVVITSVRKGSADSKYRRKWTEITHDDLMGTSAIAYDADTIILVSRKDEDNEYQSDAIFVAVLKTRNHKWDWRDRIVRLEWDNLKITEKWKVPSRDGKTKAAGE